MYLKRIKLGYAQKMGERNCKARIENISTVWCSNKKLGQSVGGKRNIDLRGCRTSISSLWKEDCLKSIHAKIILYEMLARLSKYFNEPVCCCCCCWYYCKETVNTQFPFCMYFSNISYFTTKQVRFTAQRILLLASTKAVDIIYYL